MGQRGGCLSDIGSSCGQQLESFWVTWMALEENLGRDGLGSCSIIWKLLANAPWPPRLPASAQPHPGVHSLWKFCGQGLGGQRNISEHRHNPHGVVSQEEKEPGRPITWEQFLNCVSSVGSTVKPSTGVSALEGEEVLEGVGITVKDNLVPLVCGGGANKGRSWYFWKLQNILKLFVKLFPYPACQLASFVISSTTHLFSLSHDPTSLSSPLQHKRLCSPSRRVCWRKPGSFNPVLLQVTLFQFSPLYIGADHTGELLSAPFYFLFFIPFPSVSLYPCLPLSLHSTVSIHVHASSIQLKVADKEGAKAKTGIKTGIFQFLLSPTLNK